MKYRLNILILYLLVLFIPVQMSFHFWADWTYIYGIRSDFLAPTIYVSDLLAFILFVLNIPIIKRHYLSFLVVIFFGFINIFVSDNAYVSVFKWIKIIELLFVSFLVFEQNKKIKENLVLIFSVSALPFALVGISQTLFGRTLGGILYFLGERSFTLTTPGIAHFSFFGNEYLRSYSTFPHPNSLAAYLGIVLIFLLNNRNITGAIKYLLSLIFIISLAMTASISAYVGLLFVTLFYFLRHVRINIEKMVIFLWMMTVLVSVSLPLFSKDLSYIFPKTDKSSMERIEQYYLAGKSILEKPLFGVGLGNSVSIPLQYKRLVSEKYLFQPIHNIYLQITTELGIVGLFLFVYFMYKCFISSLKNIKSNPEYFYAFLFISITGLFDHYWVTLPQNMLVICLVIGLGLLKFEWIDLNLHKSKNVRNQN